MRAHTRTHTHTHSHARTLTFRCAVEAYIAGNLSQASLALISPTILRSFELVSFWSGPIINHPSTSSNELQSLITVDAPKVGNVEQVWYFPKVTRDCRSYLIWLLQQMQEAKALFRPASFQGIRGEEHHLRVLWPPRQQRLGDCTRSAKLIWLLHAWSHHFVYYMMSSDDLLWPHIVLLMEKESVTSTVMDGGKRWGSSSHDTTFPTNVPLNPLGGVKMAWRQDVNREITGPDIGK